jgi:hypothetical protein
MQALLRFVRVVLVHLCVALPLATSGLKAQPCPPNEVQEWRPRMTFTTFSPAAAGRVSLEASLRAAEAIARKTAYAQPRGFTVTPGWTYGDEPKAGQLREFAFSAIISRNCRRYDESGADIVIIFNPHPRRWSPNGSESESGHFIERYHSEPLFGSSATFGSFDKGTLSLLFTAGAVSPTIPVTREEHLREIIAAVEGRNQEIVKDIIARASKTQYQVWLEGAEERRTRNEELLTALAAADPAQAAKTRAQLEKAERENGELLKKNEPQERIELAQARANATAFGDKIRGQIAAMTAEERAMPAWTRAVHEFAPVGAPDAYAVIKVNPEFYRARGSPVEVRAILVEFQSVPKERKAQREQMFRDFDWEAIKQLLTK